MSQGLKAQALNLYRRLLRVQRKAFVRDWQLISAAQTRTRAEFEVGRSIQDPILLRKKFTEAAEVCEFLNHNIIQAELRGMLSKNPDSAHSAANRPFYKLNFRPEIEINDGHMKGKPGKCC